MFELSLSRNGVSPREFLFIGAHCDDIEIGCGGVALRLVKEYPRAFFRWIIFSSTPWRAEEARKSSDLFLSASRNKEVAIKDFRNGYFPYVGAELKDYFEELKGKSNPDLIFTHYKKDLHQDHRVLSELTWNTFRNHFVLEFEIPKYDGGLGSPNMFFPLTRSECEEKVNILLQCFSSEKAKRWFTKDVFMGMMRLRGVECNAHSGHAEAFYCRKAVLRQLR